MQVRSLFVLTVACALLLMLALPVHGQGGIIVTGADTVREEGVSLNPGLGAVTGSVGPRVVMDNANSQRQEPLAGPPGTLQGLFSQVSARVTFQFANSSRRAALASPPGGLQTVFGAVRPRVVFDAANTSRSAALSYPVALIGDTMPAQISAISGIRQGSTASISWTTNEFATSEVHYGMQSGYLNNVSLSPFFVKQHQIDLYGLTQGATYYYKVRSVDLSGNVTLSQERVLQSQTFLFVPLIRRSN